jgi:hypothetical protein
MKGIGNGEKDVKGIWRKGREYGWVRRREKGIG